MRPNNSAHHAQTAHVSVCWCITAIERKLTNFSFVCRLSCLTICPQLCSLKMQARKFPRFAMCNSTLISWFLFACSVADDTGKMLVFENRVVDNCITYPIVVHFLEESLLLYFSLLLHQATTLRQAKIRVKCNLEEICSTKRCFLFFLNFSTA